MTRASEYARDDSELEELTPLVSWAFGDPPASVLNWLRGFGPSAIRLLRDGGSLEREVINE